VKPRPQLCFVYPFAKIALGRTHASRRGIVVTGTAGEPRCAGASAALRRRQRVLHVYVVIARSARGGRCRFLQASGKLTAPRSCARGIALFARGTTHWSLRVRKHIPPGRYLVTVDAVDGLGNHQLGLALPTTVLTVQH
jgi:hypothetical protein